MIKKLNIQKEDTSFYYASGNVCHVDMQMMPYFHVLMDEAFKTLGIQTTNNYMQWAQTQVGHEAKTLLIQ